MKKIILLIAVTLLAVICYAQSPGAKTVVLEKNEGETRVRRPLGSLPTPSAEFILKVTPQNSGSKHLVLGTEEIPPGGVIPRHKHLEQDEILLIQTGTAHVTLNDKEYDVHAGGTVFFPAQTWVGLKNIGNDNISLVYVFSAPGFEENMRCGSVLAEQSAPPITTDELKACAHQGHVEFEPSHRQKRNSVPAEMISPSNGEEIHLRAFYRLLGRLPRSWARGANKSKPLSQSNILRRSLHPVLAKPNQPKCGAHAFRHRRLTWLRKNDVPKDGTRVNGP